MKKPNQGKEPRDRCLHGDCRRQHGRVRLLSVAIGHRSLRDPGDRRLGSHGSWRNLPRAHLCQARKAAAGNRRALCLYPHRLWRFPGISDCLGLLDLDLGITAGHSGGLCRRHHRHVPRPAQPGHGHGADAGGHLGCGAHQSARRQGSRPLFRTDDLFENDTVRGDRDHWVVLHRSDAFQRVQRQRQTPADCDSSLGTADDVCLSRTRIRRPSRPAT